MPEEAPYFLAGVEILVGDTDIEGGTRPGMAAARHFVMLYRTAFVAACIQLALGRAARAFVEAQHDWQVLGRRLVEAYEAAVRARSASA